MKTWIQKAIRGQMGIYLQFLALLLLVSAALSVVMSTTGCDRPIPGLGDWCPTSNKTGGYVPQFRARMESKEGDHVKPGSRGERSLQCFGTCPPGARLTWTPPPGATNFHFDHNPQPGGPPFVWQDVGSVEAGFTYPTLPPGEWTTKVQESLQVQSNNQTSSAAMSTQINRTGNPLKAPLERAWQPAQQAPAHHDPAAQIELWQVHHLLEMDALTMTTPLCQDWLSFLQDESAFLALRAPVSFTTDFTRTYQVPVVFGGAYSNTFQLVHYGSGAVLTVPLELRPERLTFLANALPPAAGEEWLALGLAPDPVTCPPGLSLPAGNWSFESQVTLDLTHRPGNCEGCVLPTYYCYEGQQAPGVLTVLHHLWGENVTSYQGEGITCVGPQVTQLLTPPSWWGWEGAATVAITPTQAISLHHVIWTSGGFEVDLNLASTLDVAWGLYGGDGSAPDLGEPLTLPLTVNGARDVWLVSAPLPTTTLPGPYAVILTATSTVSPTNLRVTSDLMWAGDWVAPPLPPCAALEDVTLSGPTSGDPGVAYSFTATASLPTATTPFSYTWTAEGQAPVVHPYRYVTDTVEFTWVISGSYDLQVWAANCGGNPAASHTINIGAVGPGQRTVYLPLVLRQSP